MQKHAEGDVQIQTELEKMMTTEAEHFIRRHYDSIEGRQELAIALQKCAGRSGHSLLQVTGIESKIKLVDMEKSWEFTRPGPMFIHLLETFVYICISNTQAFIYFGMIFSMYQNAGIISLFYPIAVFGYALLEETRPRREFWNIVRIYTSALLLFKFLMNLSVF